MLTLIYFYDFCLLTNIFLYTTIFLYSYLKDFDCLKNVRIHLVILYLFLVVPSLPINIITFVSLVIQEIESDR
ncbi:hypothetical protein NIES2100_04950 [Calothrix sp. NIES-2100]|nr:hypothetical protein NIES2100_04950 [Calothrix sp. NIES-2100]